MNPVFISTSIEVLNGARPADLAMARNLHYGTLRDSVHRYCRKRNRPLYRELMINACASYNRTQPTLAMLREHKNEFIGDEKSNDNRSLATVKQEINILEKQQQTLSKQFRENRAQLEQRQHELKTLEHTPVSC